MTITAIHDDITTLDVDAIVNAANSGLRGGGGVDGAIHRAGGPAIMEACRQIVARQGECPAGEAVITGGGKLKAPYVIHAVGPVWHGGNKGEDELLARAYHNSLLLAARHGLKSLAFPNISTGVYGFPKEPAAKIAITQVRLFARSKHPLPDEVIFCCFDPENHSLYTALLAQG